MFQLLAILCIINLTSLTFHNPSVSGYALCNYTASVQLGIFQGRGVFLKEGHFDKRLICNNQKKSSEGKHFGDFFPRYT